MDRDKSDPKDDRICLQVGMNLFQLAQAGFIPQHLSVLVFSDGYARLQTGARYLRPSSSCRPGAVILALLSLYNSAKQADVTK